jgi:hypothetical protein
MNDKQQYVRFIGGDEAVLENLDLLCYSMSADEFERYLDVLPHNRKPQVEFLDETRRDI